jgi:hypothetical protein
MAAGVAVVVICALVAWSLFGAADHRRAVLMVTRQVAPGQALTPGDVAVVRVVVGAQVHTVPAGEARSVLGRKAIFGLTAGSLLDPAGLTVDPGLNAGQVLMGVSLKTGMFPSTVRAGDSVQVLLVAGSAVSSSSAPPGSTVAPVAARVVEVDPPAANSGDSSTTVDLIVSKQASAAIAAAAAGGQVVLAVTP